MAMLTLVNANESEPSNGMSCLRSRDPAQFACHIDGVRLISAHPDLKEVLARSSWWKRGWTYQEYVS